MSTILATGLTHLVPSDGTLVPISYTDITSSNGAVGPLTLNISNPSNTNTALFSYSAELDPQPQPPQSYTNVLIADNAGRTAHVNCTVVPGTSITVTEVLDSTTDWAPAFGNAGTILGNAIGGTTPANDIRMVDSAVDGSGAATMFEYFTGVLPGSQPAPTATAPTLGNPTKVFSIAPLSSVLVQIPSSSASLATGPIDLVASGANVYVTPVQIVA